MSTTVGAKAEYSYLALPTTPQVAAWNGLHSEFGNTARLKNQEKRPTCSAACNKPYTRFLETFCKGLHEVDWAYHGILHIYAVAHTGPAVYNGCDLLQELHFVHM